MKKILRNIFENIFWPAAAGNVFWSFCNVAINPTPSEIGFFPRLLVLLFFSLYLTVCWLQLKITPGNQEICYKYWFFEFAHLIALTVSAIIAQIQPTYLEYGLMVFFGVNSVGHFLKAWKLSEKYPVKRLIGLNILSLAILLFGNLIGISVEIRISASVISAFLLWVFVARWQTLATIEDKL